MAAGTVEKEIQDAVEHTDDIAAAEKVGEVIAQRAAEKGIKEVVFDRGGYIYMGKVAALADAARKAGLELMIDTSQMELTDKVVAIKRVTKVVKGGRNMRFTALVVVGDGNGHVGCGLGKATEIPEAIRKGREDATKNLVSVALDEVASISHDYIGKYGSASVLLKKSPDGTGIIAGGPARTVCELAGIKNIRTKSLGSNNKQNVVLATINGLSQLKVPEEVAARRGKSVAELKG